MNQFYKYILTLVVVLMTTTPAWADCVIFSDGGSYEVMNGWSQRKEKNFTNIPALPAGLLTFTYSASGAATGGVDVTATYSDGTSEKILNSSKVSNPSHNFNGKIVTKLTFKGTLGTLKKTISNVKLTRHTSISASPATLSFPLTAVEATSATQTVTITYSNIGNNYSITSTNTNDFSITPLPFTYDQCSGTMQFAITFHPQGTTGGARSGSFTIAGDGNGKSNNNTSVTINVSGTAKGFPEFTWKGNTQYYVDESLDLSNLWTTTSNETTPKYSIKRFTSTDTFGSADPHFTDATNTKILLSKEGELVLQMHQDASTTYSPLTKEVTIKIVKRPTDFTLNFANEYFVDDEINKSTFFTNATNSEVAIQVSDKTADNRALFTYNGSILKANGATLNADAETTTITITQPETYKWTGKTLTKEVIVKKYPTEFRWLLQDTYYVGETITSIFTKTNNSLPSTITSSDPTIVKVENNQLIALRAGKVRITVSQAVDRKWVAFTHEKEITIIKRNTNFQLLLGTTYYVDDRIAKSNIYSKANENPLPVSIVSSKPNILEYDATTQQLIARNAGKATITVSQAKDTTWTDFNQSLEVTILKHNIVATINPDKAVWNDLVTNPFAATSTHPVSGQVTPIDNDNFNVEQRGNEHIALMDANTRNIQTYYTNGTVDFLITRPEGRKYNALNQTLTLHVKQSTVNCPVLEDNDERYWSTINNSRTYTIPSGTPDSLFFQAKRTEILGVSNTSNFYAEYSTDNSNWTKAMTINLSSTNTWYNLKCDIPATAKYVRFSTEFGATGNKHIRNVRVTRAKSLTPSESPVKLSVTSIGTPETKTFTLKWSTCADEILLTNSNPHFILNTYRIQPTNNEGSTAIKVTCDASVVGTLRDTIIIYDNTQRIFVPVECEVNNKFIANIKGTTAYSKKVDDTWVADFKFDTCQTTLPSADINAPFYYTISHDLTGNDVLKPGYDENPVITYVPTYNPDTKEVVNTITAHNAGTAVLTFIQRPTESHYTDTLRCVITVTKYTTSFDLKGRTTYHTGDEEPYNALFNTLTNNSDVTMTFTSGDESVIKYEDSKLKALCAGSTSFTVAQAESYKWFGLSQTLNINVKKYNSNFSLTNNGADITCLIGDKIDALSLYTTANNEILPTIKSDNPAVVSFNHTTRQLEANTAGEAIITIEQPVDCKWTEYTATRKIIVHKHTPVFTFQKPVYFNDTVVDYFTTSNTQTPLSITSQTDTDVAIVYFDQNNPNDLYTTDLISFIKEDTTFVTFTQEENWYWYARTVIDTIVPIDPNNHVTFTIDTEAKMNIFHVSHTSGNSMNWSNNSIQIGGTWDGAEYGKELIIRFTGIPKDLSFDYSVANGGTTGENWYVYESEDGQTWSAAIYTAKGESGTCNKQPLNPDTRFLKLRYGGNFGCYFKNIHVTELNQFEAVPNVLDFGLQYVDNPKTTKSFDFKFANAGYKVHLESTDTMFTVATTYIDTIGGEKYGTVKDIQVTYNPLHVHQTTGEDAMILIWDEAGHRDTVFLHVNTVKSKPSLYWTEDWSAHEPIVLLGQHMPDTVAKATNGYPVKYRSDDESILKIAPDSLSFIAVGIGETYITAHADSDRVYLQPDTIRKLFRVTDKLMQYIVWEDNLTHFCIGDQPDTLHAQAWVMTDAATGEWEYSPEQTAKIQYYSSNPDVVEVQGNLLIIKEEGELLLSATINGDTTYEKTSAQVPVRVRDCSVTCSDADLVIPVINANGTVMMPEDKLEYDPYALFQNEHILRIDTTQGIPGQLIFTYRGIKAWGTLEGKIRVWESTDGGENWQQVLSDADAVEPENGVTHYSPLIPLSRNATHLKFERFPALDVKLGYHILQYITVLPDKYIESIPDDIHWGNVYVGNSPDTTIAITYSSIRSNLQIASSQPSHLKIDKSTIVDDCGAWDTVPLTISLKADISIVGNYHQYITIKDPIGDITDTIHVYANIIRNTPTITWNTTDTIRSSAEWETKKTAISSSGDPILYELTAGNLPEEFAYLNDAGKMILLRGGTVTARAYTLETTSSNAVSLSRDFFIIVDPLFQDFDNDSNWHNANNWNIGRIPWTTDSATIAANKHISLDTVIITEGLSFESGGSIHITSTGGLTVGAQGIQGAASDGSSIIIDNLKTGAGFLRISPEYQGTMPRATMRYQTRSTLDTGANEDATWQYFGAPGKDVQFTVDYITWLYQWNEKQNWVKQNGTLTLEPFAGYAITQYGKPTYALSAEAITSNQTITLTMTESGMKGNNLFANSYMAPIDVKNFELKDFEGDLVQTFYLFNSGSWNQWNGQNEKDSTIGGNGSTTPGQYCAIPALSSKFLGSEEITTIPPMQGVYVIANEDSAKIHLRYDKHVWQAGTNTDMHEPMRAPQYLSADWAYDFRRIRIQLNSANSGADRMYIIQESTTTRDYDNGYDAPNQTAEGLTNIYTTEPFGKMEVSCANNIDSMYIGFQAGKDTQYTLTFSALVGDSLYLHDLENDSIIRMMEGDQYHFLAAPYSINNHRFQLLLHPRWADADDDISTGVSNPLAMRVWVEGRVVYITNAPDNSRAMLYAISGNHILSQDIQHTLSSIDLSHVPTGVYILRINNEAFKIIMK